MHVVGVVQPHLLQILDKCLLMTAGFSSPSPKNDEVGSGGPRALRKVRERALVRVDPLKKVLLRVSALLRVLKEVLKRVPPLKRGLKKLLSGVNH